MGADYIYNTFFQYFWKSVICCSNQWRLRVLRFLRTLELSADSRGQSWCLTVFSWITTSVFLQNSDSRCSDGLSGAWRAEGGDTVTHPLLTHHDFCFVTHSDFPDLTARFFLWPRLVFLFLIVVSRGNSPSDVRSPPSPVWSCCRCT